MSVSLFHLIKFIYLLKNNYIPSDIVIFLEFIKNIELIAFSVEYITLITLGLSLKVNKKQRNTKVREKKSYSLVVIFAHVKKGNVVLTSYSLNFVTRSNFPNQRFLLQDKKKLYMLKNKNFHSRN